METASRGSLASLDHSTSPGSPSLERTVPSSLTGTRCPERTSRRIPSLRMYLRAVPLYRTRSGSPISSGMSMTSTTSPRGRIRALLEREASGLGVSPKSSRKAILTQLKGGRSSFPVGLRESSTSWQQVTPKERRSICVGERTSFHLVALSPRASRILPAQAGCRSSRTRTLTSLSYQGGASHSSSLRDSRQGASSRSPTGPLRVR